MFVFRFIGFLILVSLSNLTNAGTGCAEAELTKEQLIDIIKSERAVRTDLPKGYSNSNYIVNRQGCYYVVIESAIPERPGKNIMFKLNQRGVIVDVMRGR